MQPVSLVIPAPLACPLTVCFQVGRMLTYGTSYDLTVIGPVPVNRM